MYEEDVAGRANIGFHRLTVLLLSCQTDNTVTESDLNRDEVSEIVLSDFISTIRMLKIS